MSDPRTVNDLKNPGCEFMAEPMQVPENVIYLLQGGFEFALTGGVQKAQQWWRIRQNSRRI